MKNVITTIYDYPKMELYYQVAKESWQHYANEIGADLVTFESYTNGDEVHNTMSHLAKYPSWEKYKDRQPNWMKFAILEWFVDSEYDRLLFVDSDIYREPGAPNIFSEFPHAELAIVRDWRIACREAGIIEGSIKAAYENVVSNLPKFSKDYYNTGVMLIIKEAAKEILRTRDLIPVIAPIDCHYVEQTYLNLLIDKANIVVTEIPQCWNVFATKGFDDGVKGHFMHYVGLHGRHQLQQKQIHPEQYSFQHKYCEKGKKILNVGCETDCGGIKQTYDADNLDCNTHSILNPSQPLPVDIVCDAREMTKHCKPIYDIILIGDMFEHIPSEGRVQILREARALWRQQFECCIVVTFPIDRRRPDHQGWDDNRIKELGTKDYDSGDPAYHGDIPISLEMLIEEGKEVDLCASVIEEIHYPFGDGWGQVKGWGIVFTPQV